MEDKSPLPDRWTWTVYWQCSKAPAETIDMNKRSTKQKLSAYPWFFTIEQVMHSHRHIEHFTLQQSQHSGTFRWRPFRFIIITVNTNNTFTNIYTYSTFDVFIVWCPLLIRGILALWYWFLVQIVQTLPTLVGQVFDAGLSGVIAGIWTA